MAANMKMKRTKTAKKKKAKKPAKSLEDRERLAKEAMGMIVPALNKHMPKYKLGKKMTASLNKYMLENLPKWIARYDPGKTELSTHIYSNVNFGIRNFLRERTKKLMGISYAVANSVITLVSGRNKGENFEITLARANASRSKRMLRPISKTDARKLLTKYDGLRTKIFSDEKI